MFDGLLLHRLLYYHFLIDNLVPRLYIHTRRIADHIIFIILNAIGVEHFPDGAAGGLYHHAALIGCQSHIKCPGDFNLRNGSAQIKTRKIHIVIGHCHNPSFRENGISRIPGGVDQLQLTIIPNIDSISGQRNPQGQKPGDRRQHSDQKGPAAQKHSGLRGFLPEVIHKHLLLVCQN